MSLHEKKAQEALELELQDLAHVNELKKARRDRADFVKQLLS